MKCLAVFLLGLAACGETSVCGNGKIEPGEECDDGNLSNDDACSSTCRSQATIDTYVHFLPFIGTQFPGFTETCVGLKVAEVEIALTGAQAAKQRVQCSYGQVKFSSLPAGSYVATGTAFDDKGNPISRGLAHAAFVVAGKSQDVQVDFPWQDFTGSYTGTFYFQIYWGDSPTCAGATPPVVKQRVLLARDGVALSGKTDAGDPIDGSPGACRDGNSPVSQWVKGLDWGPAQITITGEGADGVAAFRKTFDSFVGADISNPPLRFDVPSLAPDAGAPDAAAADGGL